VFAERLPLLKGFVRELALACALETRIKAAAALVSNFCSCP
jgi:hypothetical protein